MRLPASFYYFIFMGALGMISSCTEDEISPDHFLVIAENQGAILTLIASPADGGICFNPRRPLLDLGRSARLYRLCLYGMDG